MRGGSARQTGLTRNNCVTEIAYSRLFRRTGAYTEQVTTCSFIWGKREKRVG
jgi:hypothetical protein